MGRRVWPPHCVSAAVAVLSLIAPGRVIAGGDSQDYAVTAVLGVDTVSVFRGSPSQKLNPSVSGVVEIERGSFYAGLYASPTSIQGELTSLMVGYWGVTPSAGGIDWNIGGRRYAFPGTSDFRFDLDGDGTPEKVGRKGLTEIFVKGEKSIGPVKLSAAVNYSPNMFGETGEAYYVIGAAKVRLGAGFDLRAHFGRSEFANDIYNDDYNDYAVGLYRTFFGIDMFVRYSDTTGLPGADNETVVVGFEKAWTLASREMDYKRYMREKIRNNLRIDKSLLAGAAY